MIELALRNITRRKLRSLITVAGITASIAVLASLTAFASGYRSALRKEIDAMGIQMMLVPLGCPYDAAARVVKGRNLDTSLPASALQSVRRDAGVACAAPLLMSAVPRPENGRTDMWAGITESIRPLKPWWKISAGSAWFTSESSVILGADAAALEMRRPGDKLFSPETGRTFTVAAVLERSGTSDDNLFFIPLRIAQQMFHMQGRLTAIPIRLHDPAQQDAVAERMQRIPGAQVVTLSEMLNTLVDLIGSVRALVLAISILALLISTLSVFNTMMGAAVERTAEIGLMRAVGASRGQVFALFTLEAALLTTTGTLAGLALARLAGGLLEGAAKSALPLAPEGSMLDFSLAVCAGCVLVGLLAGVCAGLYPAMRAAALSPMQAWRAEL